MTAQPIWTLAWSTDDTALYIDSTGEHDPEVAVLVQIVDDSEIESSRTAPYHVHRFPIPRVTDVETEWYSDDLASITSSAGRGDPSALADRDDDAPDGTSALRADLCSEDPSVRARAYLDIVGHWGADNFDSYPEEWSASEASEWPERGKLKIRLCPSDDDDGSITVYSDDVYGAISDRSIEGSRWEAPRDMDVAYASILNHADLLSDLEKTYDVDSSEYSPPDAEDLERWGIKSDLSNASERYEVIEDTADDDTDRGWHRVYRVQIDDGDPVAECDTEIRAWRAARDHYAKSAGPDTAHHTTEDE